MTEISSSEAVPLLVWIYFLFVKIREINMSCHLSTGKDNYLWCLNNRDYMLPWKYTERKRFL